MSFESILNEIVVACPGCFGAALMGVDGIPVAQVSAPTPPAESASHA